NDADATIAPMLQKEEGLFGFSLGAREIHNRVRGMDMWPNAFFFYGGKTIKVLKTALSEKTGEAGEIVSLNPLTVAAKDGAVELLEVKPEGSRLMTGKEWAAGTRLKIKDFIKE
ncbi:MAG: methionyl-tRNA formyltransferase, partial [Ruminococcaceae bacterium]|nr:methionyl-tRNA formyltransferase [Oscillospiraceae bacterium]